MNFDNTSSQSPPSGGRIDSNCVALIVSPCRRAHPPSERVCCLHSHDPTSMCGDRTKPRRCDMFVCSLSQSKMVADNIGRVTRQHQFPSARSGTFIRPSLPRLRRSCSGAIASADGDDQAKRINSRATSRISPSGLPRYLQRHCRSRSGSSSNHWREGGLS